MKAFLVILIVVIVVVGGAAGYLFYNSLNRNNVNGKGSSLGSSLPTMKVTKFYSSIDPYESTNTSSSVPWSSSISIPPLPYFNATVFSSTSANVRMFATSPNGTVLNMVDEPFIKYQNLSYPSGFSDFFKEGAFFEKPGSYIVSVEIFLNSTIVFKNITETINPPVKAGNISGPSGNVSLNSTLTYTAAGAHYGVPPYTYYWYVQSNGNEIELVKNQTSLKLRLNATGLYNVSLYVVDSLGYTSYSSLNVNVVAPPAVSIIPEYSQVDAGIVDNFTAYVSGGAGPFLYEWNVYYEGPVIYKGSSADISYNFTKVGNYVISLTVLDSLGRNASTSFNLTVNPIPSFNLIMEYLAIDNGMEDYANITTHGGTQYLNLTVNGTIKYYGYYYYIEYINGKQIGSYNPLSVGSNRVLLLPGFELPSKPGHYSLNFFVYDYFYAYNFTVNLTVNADLSSNITVTPSGNYSVNETVILSANYTGGTGPYNFTWHITWFNGSVTLYGQTVDFKFPYSDYYTVQLNVIDALGTVFYGGENIDYYDINVQ